MSYSEPPRHPAATFWGEDGIPYITASRVRPTLLEAGNQQLLNVPQPAWARSNAGRALRLWADPLSALGLSFPIHKMRSLN